MTTKRTTANAKPRANSPSARRLPLTASRQELLVDGNDQTLRRMTLGFAVLGWLLNDIRGGFSKLLDISPFQYVALQAIARVQPDEPWTTRSLAEHFHVTNPYVSVELRGLLSKNYLEAQPSLLDRRSKHLVVTPSGVELLTWLAPVQQHVNDTLYQQFDSEGLVRQCEVIEQMIKDAEAADQYLRALVAERGPRKRKPVKP
jgi:DNA-binding MarR family transcriptional regulator